MLKNQLENDFAKGMDSYPKTVETAMALMNQYKSNKLSYVKPRGNVNADEGVTFAQEGNKNLGKNRQWNACTVAEMTTRMIA